MSYYANPNYYNPQGVFQSAVQPIQSQNQISINLKKYDFYKGDYVEGEIVLQNLTAMILNDIHLNLYLIENWNYQEGDTRIAELNNPILLNVKVNIGKILKVNSNLINLNIGEFKFPFKFQLPDFLQPSFEYPKNNQRAFLRYVLEAKLISPYVQGDGRIYLLIKSRPKILNCPLSFSSAVNVHTWGMFDQGSTILKTSYKTSNYQMKGQIPITVEIDNTRGKLAVTSVNVKAIRKIEFKKINEATVKFTLEDIMVNKVFNINVLPNTKSQAYNYIIDLREENLSGFNYFGLANPYPKLKDLAFAMPSTDGAAIKCDYFLEVTISFDGFVTKGYLPRIIIPLTLTHQLQNDYVLEQKEKDDMKKAIEASLLDVKYVKKANDININETDAYQNNEEKLDDLITEDNPNNVKQNHFEDINQISENINQINENNNYINNINNKVNYPINDNNNNQRMIYNNNNDNNNNINNRVNYQINKNNSQMIMNNNNHINNIYNKVNYPVIENNNQMIRNNNNINNINNINNKVNYPINNQGGLNINMDYNNRGINQNNNQQEISNISNNYNMSYINNGNNNQNNNNIIKNDEDDEDMINPYKLD